MESGGEMTVNWQLVIGILTPVAIIAAAIFNHVATGRRIGRLDGRIAEVGRDVAEVRRDLTVIGLAVGYSAGRHAEADARRGQQTPREDWDAAPDDDEPVM